MVIKLYFYMELASHRLDVSPESFELDPIEIPSLNIGDPVLSDVKCVGNFFLSEFTSFAKFLEPVRVDLVEHPPLVAVYGFALNWSLRQNVVETGRCHDCPSSSWSRWSS